MNIREEIKVGIARRGTTLKKVCEELSIRKKKHYSYNNLSNKLRNGTVKFSEVEEILSILNYKITITDV